MEDWKDGGYLLMSAGRGRDAYGCFRIMKHELRTAVFANGWKYLIPAAIALHHCMVNLRVAGERWGMPDYLRDFLKGIPTVRAENHETFLLPGGWMAFFVLMLYFQGKTAKNYTGGMGMQALLRSGRAGYFWRAKWTGCILGVCIWYGAAYLTIVLFCVTVVGAHKEVWESLMHPDGREVMLQLLLPVLAACVIGIWQLVFSMCAGSLPGLFGMYSLVIVSAYFTRWYLPGNYLMKLRVEEMQGGGVSPGRMAAFLTVMLTAGVLAGGRIMKRMDYLPDTKTIDRRR